MNYKFITLSILLYAKFTYALNDTLYVTSKKNKGDYHCNGLHDQIVINRALNRVASDSNLNTVYLKGPMRCIIDEPILISSNSRLIGDSTVTVKLKDYTNWNTPNKPLIGQKNSNSSISNIEIAGFELSGGLQSEPTGKFFVILINFYDPSYVKIHDMYLHDSRGDIIRFYGSDVGKSNHIEVHNNKIENSGHEGIYFIYPNYIEVHNNKIFNTRTNSGIRVSTGSNFSIYNNIIGNDLNSSSSGYAGILIDSSDAVPIGKASIYNNYIYGKNGGIVLFANKGFDSKNALKGVHIHHNRLYKINNFSNKDYLNGAIRINGFNNTLIEYNIIDGSKKDGIVYDEHEGLDGRGKGYKTVVRYNTISNSKGYAIHNLNPKIHSFISIGNKFFNNNK